MLVSLISIYNLQEKFQELKQTLTTKQYHRTIYIDKSTNDIDINKNEKVDLILSPAFYWVQDVKLPVKYEFQAKNLLPSVFDGILSEGNYSYKTYKSVSIYPKNKLNDSQNISWMVYAYDDTIISNKLDSLKLNNSNINSIYFAQSELEHQENPIKLNDTQALVKHDNILITMPLSLTKEAKEFEEVVSSHERTKQAININRYANLPISEKSINVIAVTLIAFIGLYLTEFMINKKSLKELYTQSAQTQQTYRLPTTSFELNSMKKSLKKIASSQEDLRSISEYILNAPLKKDEHVIFLELKNSKFSVKVNLTEPKRAEIIKKYWQKKVSIKSMKVKDNTLIAKINLNGGRSWIK